MANSIPITIAYGDGIGSEIMSVALSLLKEAEVPITIESIEVGEKLYKKGYTSGIAEDTWDSIKRTKVLLKGPITTPQGGGYKSLNVTLRKTLGLFANIRPVASYHPFVDTKHPIMDLSIVRENEEDLYAGIEYRHTPNVYKSLKLISETGSEKIIRYAFEYAVKNNKKQVSCFSKDNIMKFTDGIFHKVFDRISQEYKEIDANHYIIDIGSARLANSPENFDVIVTSNLYGDIISDIAAEISGSVGLGGSSNIGTEYAMFEAVHGSAPTMASKNIANPSGMINATIMMLVHIGCNKQAELIENAVKKTIEDGVHTKDIYDDNKSSKMVSTSEFGNEIVKRLGQKPSKLKCANYSSQSKQEQKQSFEIKIPNIRERKLLGVDVFIEHNTDNVDEIVTELKKIINEDMALKPHTISTKGLKMWPYYKINKVGSDHWCIRFMHEDKTKEIEYLDIVDLLKKMLDNGMKFVSIENLYEFDGSLCFSLSQGE